jgi:hypothetical protein
LHHVLRPGLDVLGVAALEQQHEPVAAEAAREIARLHLLAQQAREVGQEILADQHAELLVHGLVLVRLDVGEAAHAGLHRFGEARAQLLDEIAAMHEPGRRVALHRFLQLALVLAGIADPRRHDDLNAGLAVELRAHQLELERRRVAADDQRRGVQRVAGPLALHAGDQRALDGRVVVRIEGVHQRRAHDILGVRIAEQREPGGIRVDDDAFLHLRDRVGRALDDVLQLLLVFAGGSERRRQRAIEAVGPELATDHQLQPRDVRERHRVLRAERQGLGDHSLVELLAHDQHRHVGREARPEVHGARQVDDALVGEQHQHFGGRLGQRVAKVAGVRQPGHVNRVAGVPERLVDGLDIVLTAGQGNHRDGGGLLQNPAPGGWPALCARDSSIGKTVHFATRVMLRAPGGRFGGQRL